MSSSARDADRPSGGAKRPARKRFPRGGLTAADKRRLRAKLLSMRKLLQQSSKDLADEVLKGSGQDFSVDHMADYGSDNFEQDFSLGLLEGETELLQAIDVALEKIDGKQETPFGICEDCAADDPSTWNGQTTAPWIPTGRLDVLPYAPRCVRHQELLEEG